MCETEDMFGLNDDDAYVETDEPLVDEEEVLREDAECLETLPAEIASARRQLWQVAAGLGLSAAAVAAEQFVPQWPESATLPVTVGGMLWAAAAYRPYDYLQSEFESRMRRLMRYRQKKQA